MPRWWSSSDSSSSGRAARLEGQRSQIEDGLVCVNGGDSYGCGCGGGGSAHN